MLIRPILALFAAAACAAEQPAPEILHADSTEIVLRRGHATWRVDLSHLIRNNDCDWPYLGDERVCIGRPTAPCPDCPRRTAILGWDLIHQRLYFAIGTGTSQNNPWTIFSYSLITQHVARFTNTWSAALGPGAVSRSGRYLAYGNFGHAGMCANSSRIEIIDLWDRKMATPSFPLDNPEDPVLITKLNWTSPTSLEYRGQSQNYADCRTGKTTQQQIEGTIDVATLEFR
jgi:hypothetical protein